MADLDPPARALEIQSRICASMGAPFCGTLLARAADDYQAHGPTRALMSPWAQVPLETQFKLATPLRWLGALHDAALRPGHPDLTQAYPTGTRPGDETGAWEAAQEAMRRDHEAMAVFMAHEPQTNEVLRSACLIGGFLTIAKATGLPLRAFELGASAGLNQNFDRFYYELGAAGTWGDGAARIRLKTDWRGGPPPLDAPLRVEHRAACDREPIQLGTEGARRCLKAYVWADQVERLERLEGAMAEAVATGVTVEARDAVDFTQARIAPKSGAATVIFHSVFWQYLAAEQQLALAQAIESAGAAAGADAPLAWLRMEPRPPSVAAEMEVRLTLWPGGEDRRLALCHAHGAWVEWAD